MRLLRDIGERLEPGRVVTIGVFRDHSVEEMIKPFAERYEVSWPLARDPEFTLLGKLGFTAETSYAVVVLNAEGKLAIAVEGPGKAAMEKMEAEIEKLVQ